ncbi:DUF86 domain-containing protein [Microbacterium sp. 179-I 3D3 NHS]|uniref:HepT-like ribonuclease domain-containing protein n=1 Tax=Microbacterium sp. 179-I 3D3 NHS TaxID=3142382 RepID=UPI00399F4017
MSRHEHARLQDIASACAAIARYVDRGDVEDDIVFDAIRIRLLEIGEAVKDLEPEVLAAEPAIPWREIARMRDQIAHRYFDTAHAIVHATARHDIPRLAAATQRLLAASAD